MGTTMEREWNRLLRREAQLLRAAEEKDERKSAGKWGEITGKIEEKIPEKLTKTLDAAFHKAFFLIFDKGTDVIEKTFRSKELQMEFRVNDFRVEQQPNRKSLRKLEKTGKRSALFNSCATTAEGIGLGLLGIGLPDIPLFLAMLLKGLYEMAASYGYDYHEQQEQILILRIITAALTDGAEKRTADARVEEWLQADVPWKVDFEEEVGRASSVLSAAMLTGKFIQGLPVVGAVGGVQNPLIYHKVLQYAALKYKKRYLSSFRLRKQDFNDR